MMMRGGNTSSGGIAGRRGSVMGGMMGQQRPVMGGNVNNPYNNNVDPLLLDPSLDPEYGQPEIGLSELVSAVITFDYIIYVGDEIKTGRR